jgi:DCN1-like protein 1/2
MQTVSSNLSDYDAEGDWPYLIDEFVDYLKENGVNQHGQINDSSLN